MQNILPDSYWNDDWQPSQVIWPEWMWVPTEKGARRLYGFTARIVAKEPIEGTAYKRITVELTGRLGHKRGRHYSDRITYDQRDGCPIPGPTVENHPALTIGYASESL